MLYIRLLYIFCLSLHIQTSISSSSFRGWFWRLSYWGRRWDWGYNTHHYNFSQNHFFTAVLFQKPICEECEKVDGDLKCVKCECIFCQPCFDMVSHCNVSTQQFITSCLNHFFKLLIILCDLIYQVDIFVIIMC